MNNNESLWLSFIIDRIRPELNTVCADYGVEGMCIAVLESIAEVFPTWFEGKKKKTIIASILYISKLIAKGPRRGTLKLILDSTKATKPAVNDAVSKLIKVNWELGIIYTNVKFFVALKKRISIPDYIVPYTVAEVVRVKLRLTFPGLFELLEIICKKNTGKDCISLLIEDPAKLRDVILERYSLPLIVKRIAEKILRPLVEELDVNIPVPKLVDLFMDNPEELKKILSRAFKKY
ncbi:MAG: hypothetical protein QXL96_06630 [Ignisphaera sp.]